MRECAPSACLVCLCKRESTTYSHTCHDRVIIAMLTRLRLLLVVAWTLLPNRVRGLASCCVNSTSGVDFDDCVCLVDNTEISGHFLAAGETRLYHWVLSANNSELVSGAVRGNLTFEVRTICTNWSAPEMESYIRLRPNGCCCQISGDA